MQVVDLLDVVDPEHVGAHLRQIQLLGSETHEDVARGAQQGDGPRQDERGDDEGDRRVRTGPAGVCHDDSGDDDADRSQGVVDNLQEGCAHVEVVAVPAGQYQ